MDPRLRVPGTPFDMRVSSASPLSCVALLEATPIVVAYGDGAPSVVFDADVLASGFGAAWPAVDRALAELTPAAAHEELRALTAVDGPLSDATAAIAEAEARLIEGDDAAARAVIVLALLQARIAAIVERG